MEFSFYSLIALLDRVDGDETVRSLPRQASQVMKESMSFQFLPSVRLVFSPVVELAFSPRLLRNSLLFVCFVFFHENSCSLSVFGPQVFCSCVCFLIDSIGLTLSILLVTMTEFILTHMMFSFRYVLNVFVHIYVLLKYGKDSLLNFLFS